MRRGDFHMLDVYRDAIDAGLPGDNRIDARIDGRDLALQQDLIAQIDLSRQRFDVEPAPPIGARNHRVLGSADHGCAKCDDVAHQVRALTRTLPGQIAAETPTYQIYVLAGSAG